MRSFSNARRDMTLSQSKENSKPGPNRKKAKRFQVVLVFDFALLNVSKEHVVENAVVALVLPFCD